MTNSRRLYRLSLPLGLMGVGGAALGMLAGVHAISLRPGSLAALMRACHRLLVPHFPASALALLALTVLGAVVVARAATSLGRQFVACRRLVRRLRPIDRIDIGGATVEVIDKSCPEAFCAGYVRPRIIVSTGALESLSRPQIEAVVRHEQHHKERRDPLRLCLARVLGDALFFLPSLRRSLERCATFAELEADEAALRTAGRQALASALLLFGRSHANADVAVGIAPERVDQLAGREPHAGLSLAAPIVSVLSTSSVVAAIVATVALARGASLDLSLLLAQSCMTLMVALPLIALAWAAYVLCPRRAT